MVTGAPERHPHEVEESERLKLLGRQIRRLRQDRETPLSVEKLANKAGINRNHLYAIEIGDTKPGVDKLFKIADALGVSIVRLFETLE